MVYSAIYSKSARKYLHSQTMFNAKRIMDAVDGLPKGDVKKLQGRSGYRLTVGSFRILFDYVDSFKDGEQQVIDVFLIGPRGDVYKK